MNIHTLVQYLDATSDIEESNTEESNIEESNTEESNTSLIYTFLGNPEEESTVLSTNLDLCVDPLFWTAKDTKLRVYICMYRRTRMVIPVCSKVRDLLPIEYLSFFMEKNEKSEYSFPSFSYKCNDTNSESEEEGLKSACISHILTVRSLEQAGLANLKDLRTPLDAVNLKFSGETKSRIKMSNENTGFKGFIEDKKKVFVFFDSDKFETVFRKNDSSDTLRETWAIVDEILNKKKVLDVDIDPVIVRMFVKNPIALNIKYNGQDIAYPRQMYALIPSNIDDIQEFTNSIEGFTDSEGRSKFGRDNVSYENEYETETYPSTGKTLLHMSMALPYSYSDIFADRYLFTNEPISGERSKCNYKRYACFVYNPRTILDPTYKPHRECIQKYPNNTIEHIRLEAEDDEMAEDIRETPCIVFVDNLRSLKRKGKKIERTTIWGFLQYTYFREL